jgi:hypothetical protein
MISFIFFFYLLGDKIFPVAFSDGQTTARGQTRPPEGFYPARDMIPNLTNKKNKN